jgi:hypothetical protein
MGVRYEQELQIAVTGSIEYTFRTQPDFHSSQQVVGAGATSVGKELASLMVIELPQRHRGLAAK